MIGIIKRRKTTEFAQIHNQVLQNLDDICSIGLIAHLMSMPSNWNIKKTHLYSKFGRGQVTRGIAELEQKKYWVHIAYRDGKQNLHEYHVSDVAFIDEEVIVMIKEVLAASFKIKSISAPFQHLFDDHGPCQNEGKDGCNQPNNNPQTESEPGEPAGKDQESSSVDFQQLKINCSISTVENEQLLNKEKQTNSKQINKDQRNLVNLQGKEPTPLNLEDFRTALTTACDQLHPHYAPGRWSKLAWRKLIGIFVEETIEAERYKNIPATKINNYALAAINNMAQAFDRKNGRKMIQKHIPTRPVPFYDWVSCSPEKDG